MSSHPTAASTEALADTLLAEFAGMEGRPYEEIGVPAFFVGEDLTGAAAPARDGGDPLSGRFAMLAAALTARKPDPEIGDIGRMMEVFSDREFPDFGPQEPLPRLVARDMLAGPGAALPDTASPTLREVVAGMADGRAIRAVNFHATPRYREAEFRRQIAAYAETFEPVTGENFAAAVAGDWPHARPGLMPILFEGFRDNYDVMLPILEEYGFTGWFFVPSAFPGLPAGEQREYAAAHELDPPAQDEYLGERIAITWDEARDISRRGHMFACHSRNHSKVAPDTPLDVLHDEIVTAKAEMEAGLGHPVDIFCWLGAAAVGVNADADRLLLEAGFRYLVSAFKIQKLQ